MLVVLFLLLGILMVVSPGFRSFVSAIGYLFEKKFNEQAQMAKKVVIVYCSIYGALMIAGMVAIVGEQNIAFSIICLLMAVMLLPIWSALKTFSELIEDLAIPLPIGLKYPANSALLISALLFPATIALLFPDLFYNGFGLIVLLLVIVGLAVRTAFGSTEPVAAKILAGLICLAVATAAVLALFPTQVEAFFIWRNISQAKWSRENASDKLLERPVYKVLERTNLWKVKRKPWGSPELDENGIPKVVPCQIKNSAGQLVSSLEPGEEFITTQVKFKTVDALEVLIPITLRGPDGTWIQPAGLEGNDECLALLSKTTLMFHEQTKANPETGKAFERFSLHLQNLQIPATGPFNTGAYISKGQKVWITATGKVNAMAETEQSSPRYRWVGPSGWASNPEFISGSVGPLLIDEPYMALAATINPISPRIDDGGWVYIGSEKTIEATREGYLFLIVNDRKSQHDVNRDWFNHTQGGFIVEVKVR